MLGSVRDIARTFLAYAETRTRLAAGELEEQALRFAEIAVWAAIAFFFFAVGLVFVAVVLVLLFSESHPAMVAGAIAALFFAAGAAGALRARLRLRERPPLLAGTVAELAKDRERMQRPATAEGRGPPDA